MGYSSSDHLVRCATLVGPDSHRGLVIVGLNWGGDPSEPILTDEVGYFSDKTRNPSRFKSRMHTFFRLMGHPLTTDEPGWFERSITHTNWYQSKTPRSNGLEHPDRLRESVMPILLFLNETWPRLTIFTSRNMLEAFRFEMAARYGFTTGIEWRQIGPDSKGRQFVVGIWRNPSGTFVSIPHPTGARGLSDEHLVQISRIMGPILKDYKEKNVLFPWDVVI